MNKRPLLSFAVCWVIGSAAGCLFSGYQLLMYAAGCLLLLAVGAVSRKTGWKTIVVLGGSLAAAALYWEWNEGRNISLLPVALEQSVMELNEAYAAAAGAIVSPVERDGDRVDFTVKLSGMKPGGNDGAESIVAGELIAVQIKLQAESEIAVAATWKRGDHVVIEGELEQPAEARNFGGFDYRSYLLTQRIHWLLKGDGTGSVHAEPPASWSPSHILRWNDAARAALGAEMDRLFQKPHAGYMKVIYIKVCMKTKDIIKAKKMYEKHRRSKELTKVAPDTS